MKCRECSDPPEPNRVRCAWHLEIARMRSKEWYERNAKRVQDYQRQRRQDPVASDKVRDAIYRRRYGITLEQYNALLEEQGGVCAICFLPERTNKYLAVDHDHETDAVRGLLCNDCNRGIGLLGDDPARLARAVDYLAY